MTRDSKGNPIKVGDEVIVVSYHATDGPIKISKSEWDKNGWCSFTKDIIYKVTGVFYKRIDVIHEPTGGVNGWGSEYFINLTNHRKSNLPKWF